jgi:hypothetical protein
MTAEKIQKMLKNKNGEKLYLPAQGYVKVKPKPVETEGFTKLLNPKYQAPNTK